MRLIHDRNSWNASLNMVMVSFCSLLFTFNKYLEFKASRVISVHEAVGLWRMDFEQSLW